MGEIFERTTPAFPLSWTGERLVSGITGQVEIEHLHRYAFARELCRGLDVLDIASGEGYGTALLAQVCRSVIGVEIDVRAVEYASAAYQKPNLCFMKGDARAIPLPDGAVDVVVSFETIEHFYEHENFISEVRRVLRPNGKFIVSSPERDIYSPAQRDPNPFHVRELTGGEFDRMLRGSFSHVIQYGQRSLLGAALVAEAGADDPIITFERRGQTAFEASLGLPLSMYRVAIASDATFSAPRASLYIDTSDIDRVFARAKELNELQPQAEAWRQQLLQSNSDGDDLRHQFGELCHNADEWRRGLLARNAEVESLRAVSVASLEAHSSELKDLQADLNAKSLELGNLAQFAKLQTSEICAKIGQNELQGEQLAKLGATLVLLSETLDTALDSLTRLEVERDGLVVNSSRLQKDVTTLDKSLNQILLSTSWRLTAPMRGVAIRNPWLVGFVRKANSYNPALVRSVLWLLRLLWRVVTLRSPWFKSGRTQTASKASLPEAKVSVGVQLSLPSLMVQDNPIIELGVIEANVPLDASTPNPVPSLWLYLGDTIEWLGAHAQCSGVGRVTAELFFASLKENGSGAVPCARTPYKPGLGSLSRFEVAQFFAARVGANKSERLRHSDECPPVAPGLAFVPIPGDHIIFTGVVWTQEYITLFESISSEGMRFSVLVYDIIPLDSPYLVNGAGIDVFRAWLRKVLALADVVFVSSDVNKNQILRWATLDGTAVCAKVIPIVFGSNKALFEPTDKKALLSDDWGVRTTGYVLSVGTIDHRKNQQALCVAWVKLCTMLGSDQVPQLVLVGRDDIGVDGLSVTIQELVATKKILVLQRTSDLELVELYRDCLFTVFPSLSEGYGLPVAESLAYGKLCIASDLAVIRDHAGDLPWYVEPGDPASLFEAVKRALTDLEAVNLAQDRILRLYRTQSWEETWGQIVKAVTVDCTGPRTSTMSSPQAFPGNAPVVIHHALHQALTWCTDKDPEVSIVIVNWHATPLTIECVRHVWSNTSGCSYEIIIVDNGSDPDSLVALNQLGHGVSLVSLMTNRFFGEANNIAAERAKGKYLCLLNNDAFVQSGWLCALVSSLEGSPGCGAVGPLFLFPDGSIQEAGGSIDSHGFPVRALRGELTSGQTLTDSFVDYVSAATLLIQTSAFLEVGGFDLLYEPAYYEDVDLCLKLRAAGHAVRFSSAARVVHVEGAAANDSAESVRRRNALGDINRGKFVARWHKFLATREFVDLEATWARIRPASGYNATLVNFEKRAVLFSPFMMSPGGGERVLLTIASILSEDHSVFIATPYQYSQLRMADLGRELDLNLTNSRFITQQELLTMPVPDVMVTLSNHIVPPIVAHAENAVMICQFPFPLGEEEVRLIRERELGQYRAVIAYSDYARSHVVAALSAHQMPALPVEILYPPVPGYVGDPELKRPIILSVGRFFAGGHSKRQDLMIDAFRNLLDHDVSGWELHIAGASVPSPAQIDYLSALRLRAADLPVVFHVNASKEQLAVLYRDASIYWHASGLDVPLIEFPGGAEHFGITIVEAMSAGCVPIVFNSGGPREIVSNGVNGILYGSIEELVEKSLYLIAPDSNQTRKAMARAAISRAADFSTSSFREKARRLLFDQHLATF